MTMNEECTRRQKKKKGAMQSQLCDVRGMPTPERDPSGREHSWKESWHKSLSIFASRIKACQFNCSADNKLQPANLQNEIQK